MPVVDSWPLFGLNADFFAMLLDCDGGTNKLRIYLIWWYDDMMIWRWYDDDMTMIMIMIRTCSTGTRTAPGHQPPRHPARHLQQHTVRYVNFKNISHFEKYLRSHRIEWGWVNVSVYAVKIVVSRFNLREIIKVAEHVWPCSDVWHITSHNICVDIAV